MTFTFGSLFAGIGGFDLGLERAGMECRWQVEIDDKCREVLAYHWPDIDRSVTDVTTAGRRNLEPVDLVCGGFPCQDLSVAGKREGLSGERSGLWFEFHRVLEEIKPRWVVVENVPGLLSSNGGADFAIVLRGLVELGYGVCWRVLDARYFGIPQIRRRVFIVGHLRTGCAAQVLFDEDAIEWHLPPGQEAGQEIARTIGGSSQGGGYRTTDLDNIGAFVFESRYARNGRGAPSAICPPLKAFNGGTSKGDGTPLVLYDNVVRRMMPLEWERLQGFPDYWTARQADTHRYKQTGNAVAVPCAEWLGRRIMEVERTMQEARP